MHISYTISYMIWYVRRTMSYVKIQVLASRTCNVAYDVVYYVVCFLYDIVRATYDIAKKCTTSYVFYRFLPVVRATSHTTLYVFWRCRIRNAMQHQYYTMSYGRFWCRWFTSPITYDIVLRRRMQYCSIQYKIRSILCACLGRRQAWLDILAMPLQLPRVLLPDPRPCRMVCIAQAQCRAPFPHWHAWSQSISGGRSPGSGQLPWPVIHGLWTQKILTMVSPSHCQMQAHKKKLIIDIFLQLTPS